MGKCADLEKLLSICKKGIFLYLRCNKSFGTKCTKGKLNKYTGTIGKWDVYPLMETRHLLGGGMILTNDKKLAKKAKYLVNQAKDDSLNT